MSDSLATLRAANRALKLQADEQSAQISHWHRFNDLLSRELAELQWRHFALCRELFGPPELPPTPPRRIPRAMMRGFTMGGRVEIEDNYGNRTYPSNWPLIYTDEEVDRYLAQIAEGSTFIYGQTDLWVREAIERYPVKGLQVANMGSLTPWYESTCLHYGGFPSTIDYNPILSRTDRIRTWTTAQWETERPQFDYALSISSFEHDGLGMYGDPLDPDGDLKAMARMRELVKPDGILLLSVPVGRDKVIFNNARVYGRVRIPALIEGWEEIERIGLEPEHLDGPGHIQPIFVLRNPAGT